MVFREGRALDRDWRKSQEKDEEQRAKYSTRRRSRETHPSNCLGYTSTIQ